MNKKTLSFVSLILTLVLLTSCTKKVEDISAPSPTTTGAIEEQVLNDINKELDTIEKSIDDTTKSVDAVTPAPVSTGSTSATIPASSEAKMVQLSQKYKDPAGENEITFDVETKEGKITSVKAMIVSGSDVAKKLSGAFNEAAAKDIVGKSLAEAGSLSAVGGASLTTGAFKEALKSM